MRASPHPIEEGTAWMLLFGAWLVAALATGGALFLSEIMKIPPCVLCWYQRIFMFPLVLVLAFAMFPLDVKVVRYALPLAIGGWLVGAYQLLLMAGYIPKSAVPCGPGIDCSQAQIEWFGFVTIPLLSVIAFSLVAGLLVFLHARSSK
jgi:disulfide bond formation protein DsbB